MLYGEETWALIGRLTSILLGSCDRKMIRYMAGVTWMDRASNLEVAGKCGVRESVGCCAEGEEAGKVWACGEER